MLKYLILSAYLFSVVPVFSQKQNEPKYPSVFWEITGNGLKQPSYLFGTMHVSKKLAFHLSDSFYTAMQRCDMVALELNPFFWQRDMMKMEEAQLSMTAFYGAQVDSYLREVSFSIRKFDDNLKNALAEEPSIINGLLYRTFMPQADFEENTYLDLYIYQTGRKLGKKAGGVEDYYQTQQIVMDAYKDMAKERSKNKAPGYDEQEPYYDIQTKIEEAYKRGNLDLMDSLQKKTETSVAFNEKFLYLRNEIQANSIDTILKKNSLFVGVGAAHLPGSRGIIELLRKKGYILRPIFMPDRDATKKDETDKIKVPVVFTSVTTQDGAVAMQLPGPLYNRNGTDMYVSSGNKGWQYADMDNGVYYMLTRINTHAAMLGMAPKDVLKKIDSLLYENIPGKILKKTNISRNGYSGFDITNRTRRGDIQRYNVLVTPFEIMVFKMSGNDEYVSGAEADTFFNSITLKKQEVLSRLYEISDGGFKTVLPHYPYINSLYRNGDRGTMHLFESADSVAGKAYLVYKKNVSNFSILEEDTFELSLLERSFKKSTDIEKQLNRLFTKQNGYNALRMQFLLKDGKYINALAVIRGPHYYVAAERTPVNDKNFTDPFFSSFSFTDFKYGPSALFTDSLLKISANTPVKPEIDTSLINMVTRLMKDKEFMESRLSANYWPENQYASFISAETGEAISVNIQEFPKYYYSKDSAAFWKNQLDNSYFSNNDYYDDEYAIEDNLMQLYKKDFVVFSDSCKGYKMIYRDTNTVKQVTSFSLLQQNKLYTLTHLGDTLEKESTFIQDFFKSFKPIGASNFSVFENKTDSFFADFYSKDSLRTQKAKAALYSINFGESAIDKISAAIKNLPYGSKDYFDTKQKLIDALGSIDDSCCSSKVTFALKAIYENTADTGSFQNAALISLAGQQTDTAYQVLKELLIQSPPVFEEKYGYSRLFNEINDSLLLAKKLFPEILQLASIEDYKSHVNKMLKLMVDSGQLSAKDYESYFSKILFDAKIEWKKQQNADEKILDKESNEMSGEEDAVAPPAYSPGRARGYTDYVSSPAYNMYGDGEMSDVNDYAALLIPFYDASAGVKKFFEQLLSSKNDEVKMNAAVLLLKYKKPLADSVLTNLAEKDDYRIKLYRSLEKAKLKDHFPTAYKSQEAIAKSFILRASETQKFADIKLVSKKKIQLKKKEGYVFFFKYKKKKDGEWLMGICGTQPVNEKEINSEYPELLLTAKKITTEKTEMEQFEEELDKLMLEMHPTASRFFEEPNKYGYSDYGDYEE